MAAAELEEPPGGCCCCCCCCCCCITPPRDPLVPPSVSSTCLPSPLIAVVVTVRLNLCAAEQWRTAEKKGDGTKNESKGDQRDPPANSDPRRPRRVIMRQRDERNGEGSNGRRRKEINLNTTMERTRAAASRAASAIISHRSRSRPPRRAACASASLPLRCCCPHRLTDSNSLIVALVWHASVTS